MVMEVTKSNKGQKCMCGILKHVDLGPVAMPILNLIQFKLNLALSMYLVK